MRVLTLLIIISSLTACHCSKKVTSADAVNSVTELNDSIFRVTVSFYSKGGGIDKKAKSNFATFLENYDLKNKAKLSYETANWGREGETDYCFKLSELNADRQVSFVSELKETLKESALVRIKENTTCRKSRR